MIEWLGAPPGHPENSILLHKSHAKAPTAVIQISGLDPLRDEGLAYYRKLLAAGVEATAEVNLGVVHGSAILFRKLLPEVHNKAVKDVAAFAKSL